MNTNINLEHLRAFVAVAEFGGVNKAAEQLFKSPSTISHALSRLQAQLDIALFIQQGRKLSLTMPGTALLEQARVMLDEKQRLLTMATQMQQQSRLEVSLAMDTICPHDVLLGALAHFSDKFPLCNIKLYEGVLSGAEERLLDGSADVCVAYRIPQGFLGEKLLDVAFVPVVSATHPLAKVSEISSRVLMKHRQVVISDSGQRVSVDFGWLKATQRWSVASMHTAIEIISRGMAFGWIPVHLIEAQLASGGLQRLRLNFGGERVSSLYITLVDDRCSLSQALAKSLKKSA